MNQIQFELRDIWRIGRSITDNTHKFSNILILWKQHSKMLWIKFKKGTFVKKKLVDKITVFRIRIDFMRIRWIRIRIQLWKWMRIHADPDPGYTLKTKILQKSKKQCWILMNKVTINIFIPITMIFILFMPSYLSFSCVFFFLHFSTF
jgi:hypothetical protein